MAVVLDRSKADAVVARYHQTSAGWQQLHRAGRRQVKGLLLAVGQKQLQALTSRFQSTGLHQQIAIEVAADVPKQQIALAQCFKGPGFGWTQPLR